MKSGLAVLRHAFQDFGADRCSEHAAALSYYTIFALPPLLMLLLLLGLGMLVDPAKLRAAMQGRFSGLMGQEAASAEGRRTDAAASHGGDGRGGDDVARGLPGLARALSGTIYFRPDRTTFFPPRPWPRAYRT